MKKVFKIFLLLLMAACFNASVSAQTSCRSRDSLILRELYTATGGQNWKNTLANNQKWMVPGVPINQWYGITLNANGCVISIDLDNNPTTYPAWGSDGGTNNLSGQLPSSLGNLSELRELTLTNNPLLTGPIPSSLRMTKLEQLYLFGNRLSGPIPPELGQLTNLLFLYLNNNQLINGNIPPQLGTLSNLIVMHLADNQLSGAIPPSMWSNFPRMTELWLQNNKLSGGIPSSLSLLKKLEFLLLYGNPLGGTIPSSLGSLPELRYLGLMSNQLTGGIPTELGSLTKLIQTNMSNNALTGSIPISFNNLTNLEDLVLHHNILTGTIPPFTLPNMSRFRSFSFGFNKIDSIPNLSALTNLTVYFVADSNKVTFDDILPNLSPSNRNITYAPQDSIFTTTTYNKNEGESLIIDLGIDLGISSNVYKWFKDGSTAVYTQTGGTGTSGLVVGNKLVFNSLSASDAGIYTCQVTNPNAPLLTLYSRKAIVNVKPCCKPIITLPASVCRGRVATFVVEAGGCKFDNGRWDFGGTVVNPTTTTYIFGAVGTFSVTFSYTNACGEQEILFKKRINVVECYDSTCCDKVVIQPSEPCCSQLQLSCPVRSVKVSLANGTFTALNGTCFGAPIGSVGLSTYTLTPQSTCNTSTIYTCFKATGVSSVGITYLITFMDGTTCEKQEKKQCITSCCEKAIITPITDQCRSQLQITGECAVKSIKIDLVGGKFTTFSSTCGSPNVTGLSSFVITPTTTCTNAFFAPYFQATSLGTVTINYTVTFTDGTTCVKTETKKCCCTPKVTVPETGCKGTPVRFVVDTATCKLTNGRWDFGDGTSSNIANTTHIYNTVGTFTAIFTYTNDCGSYRIPVKIVVADCCCEKAVIVPAEAKCCSQIKIDCQVKSVKVTLTGGTFTSLNWTCNPVPTGFAGLSTYTLTPVLISRGDCASTSINACFQSTGLGTVTISYFITFADGTTCEKKETKLCCCTPDIKVSTSGCRGIAMPFKVDTAKCKFIKGYWDFGDGTTSTIANTTHVYNSVGGYEAIFYYTNDCGSFKTAFKIGIEQCPCDIKPCFYVKTQDLDAYFAGGGTTSTYPISGYHWDFGDGSWANGVNPVHTYAKEGTYKVCLTVYADNGEGLCGCVSERLCIEVVVKKGLVASHTTCEFKPVAPPTVPSTSSANSTTTSLKMSVFPNPVSDNLTVVFDKQVSDTEGGSSQLELYNLQGQLLKQQPLEAGLDETKVSMQQLPAGVYMISLRQNGQIISSVKVTKN